MLIFITLIFFITLPHAKAVEAGMAIGVDNKILETSKQFILEHLQNTLNSRINIPNFSIDFMGSNHMTD